MRLVDADFLAALFIERIKPDGHELANDLYQTIADIIAITPTIDAVPTGVYEQLKWERDQAINTLDNYGIGLGEILDLVEVIRCGQCRRWAPDGGYCLDLDGNRIRYGMCDLTKMACQETHFCSSARKSDGEQCNP